MTELDTPWATVDWWWERYVEAQEADLTELHQLFDALAQTWDESDCPFNTDPLSADWTATSPQTGPLRVNQEENWSQWLAHLIRDSTGEWLSTLFGPRFDLSPSDVQCERPFHDEELHDRRVDILAEFPNYGLTIEVKIGDEDYEKTPQTAYLTEKHHPDTSTWTHYLLLPPVKRGALQDTFENRMTDREEHRPTIATESTHERDIRVLYWDEVAYTLRTTLLDASEPSIHWTASAYLFTTLIEEQILQFYPIPDVTERHNANLGVPDIERLQSTTPNDQIKYLDAVLSESTHE
jgi:hypothetical protein